MAGGETGRDPEIPGDRAGHGEIWGDLGRYGEIWGDLGRSGEMLGGMGRSPSDLTIPSSEPTPSPPPTMRTVLRSVESESSPASCLFTASGVKRRCSQRRERELAGELPIHSQWCEETLLTAAVEPPESRCLRSAAAVQKAGRTGSPYCRT